MTRLYPYLNFPGCAEEAFNFYRSVFGGEFMSVFRFKDLPMPGLVLPREAEDKLMHIALPVGGEILMASDGLESMGQKVVSGNSVALSVHPDTKAEADRLFAALAAGGTVEMPIADQVWGDYYGSLVDRYGIRWMVNFAQPPA